MRITPATRHRVRLAAHLGWDAIHRLLDALNPEKPRPLDAEAKALASRALSALREFAPCSTIPPREDGEHCQCCGRAYDAVWRAPDALWANVTGRDDRGGLRCMPCFAAEAEARGISLLWECRANEYPTAADIYLETVGAGSMVTPPEEDGSCPRS